MSTSSTSTSAAAISQSVSLVMQLNNEGIQQLEAQNFESAIKSLSKAVSHFKKSIAVMENENPSLEENLFFAFKLTASAMQKTDESTSSNSFVFDSPIRIAQRQSKRQISTRRTGELLKMMSFALVFNLALAFHLASSSVCSSKANKHLTKALAFYKLATNMIRNENLSLGVMEALAVANNQAHVHLQLGDIKEADQCYDQVRSQVMVVADLGQQSNILLFEQFFATAVVKPFRTAPAA
ncbi:expressed unknown protein [Seminavis robusta]|uniref:Uncharacterized protein n=1 Tax=Seminavis robusta TaxID=568900 RepID=A0A9N8DWN1_9STRA|nr:expressed unknown protein [Seminavis robusta]|eukprot:Sro351_g123840.1 n/a (239) ;mRNA; r:12049-12765